MYYARLVIFKLGAGQRQVGEQLTKKFDKVSRILSGFRGSVYFFDDLECEYRALNYWDTKADAEQAHEILHPKFENELKKYSKEKPTYKILEVYDASEDSDVLISHIKI